ncbi:MAG: hypothetical protein LBT53_10160 [Puniceicoccales bacterium]|jgi:hypothetical protein|nr:hypothetical protein [Puniceicoccales bacterium]
MKNHLRLLSASLSTRRLSARLCSGVRLALAILPCAFAVALAPTPAFGQFAGAARTAPKPVEKNADVFVMNTPDGLPLEVRLVSFHSGVLKIASTATNEEYSLRYDLADKPTQALVSAIATAERQNILRLPAVNAQLKSNDTPEEIQVTARHSASKFSHRGDSTKNAEYLPDAPLLNAPRAVARGNSVVYFPNLSLPKEVRVDLPVELHLFWFKKNTSNSSQWLPSGREKITFLMTDLPADYVSAATGNSTKDPNFSGFAYILVNLASKTIVSWGASGSNGSAMVTSARNLVMSGSSAVATPPTNQPKSSSSSTSSKQKPTTNTTTTRRR